MPSPAILVIGGGISGLTAALEVAEVGHEVFLVEKRPFLGGRVAQLASYFPKLCPPSCGLEIQFQRLRATRLVRFFTLAEVVGVTGAPGDYAVTVRCAPRFVTDDSLALDAAAAGLSRDVPNPFDAGLGRRKALYRETPFAFPHRLVLESEHCTGEDLVALAGLPGIDLQDAPREVVLPVGAIIFATGWQPYDVTRLTELGAGGIANCITNLQFERLAAPNGPTGGVVVRPLDGKAPRRVAFIQCAGSRDVHHLDYCSSVCCLTALKHAARVVASSPQARASVYFIDQRTFGRDAAFAAHVLADDRIRAVRGKVAAVAEDPGSGDVLVTVEDTATGIKAEQRFDLAVLATGMRSSLAGMRLPVDMPKDDAGFLTDDAARGLFVAGCAREPLSVMRSTESATAAAMRAVAFVRGGRG